MVGRRRARDEPEGRESGPPADPVAVAREIALRQLTVRARSRAELAEALAKKDVPDEVAEQVLERFSEVGLIDDADFATQWAESRQRAGRSTRVIRQELRTKGVDDALIGDALGALDDEADYESALALGRKKAASTAGLERQVRYRRIGGALARRGFSGDVVRRVLSDVLDADPDDLP